MTTFGGGFVSMWRHFVKGFRDLWRSVTEGEGESISSPKSRDVIYGWAQNLSMFFGKLTRDFGCFPLDAILWNTSDICGGKQPRRFEPHHTSTTTRDAHYQK